MGIPINDTGYFSSFQAFIENEQRPILAEFNRLAASQGWGKKSSKYRTEKMNCLRAESKKYLRERIDSSSNFGNSYQAKLGKLQALCREMGVGGADLGSLKNCNNVLASVHVNMVDLLDSRRLRKKVKMFHSNEALQEYTFRTGKFFPKDVAKEDGVLRVLLRGLV